MTSQAVTVGELQRALGQTVAYSVNGLFVQVYILNVKQSYGRIRYQVRPVAGCGTVWIDASSTCPLSSVAVEVADDFQAQEQDGLIY